MEFDRDRMILKDPKIEYCHLLIMFFFFFVKLFKMSYFSILIILGKQVITYLNVTHLKQSISIRLNTI